MRFLANENFPRPSIEKLRLRFEVISIAEVSPGISDFIVLEKALIENLIILTFDRDYGEMIFRDLPKKSPALIYFRFKGKSPTEAANLLLKLIDSGKVKFNDRFSVIEENGIRQRTYI